MDYNVHKVCRVCLEEGAVTSIYSTDFAMMPSTMMMMCAKIRIYKTDGLPSMICNNCIYRLGVAYHFKQECENSDLRLRQYLGIMDSSYGFCDATTMTDKNILENPRKLENDDDEDDEKRTKKKKRSRYQKKAPEERKKRGPKPIPKVPQTCYECNKTFKCSAQLQMHMRTHTGERPYSCSYCSRRFAQKYNLLIHIRTHTGERPFQCEICSKQFSALGNFQAHQKIHTGIRDQVCPVCSKAFYNSGDLTKHMITHTGLKNHHCDICGKSFSRNRDMVAHKKKIHLNERNTENYKCPECRKVFANSSGLSLHFRTVHEAHMPPPPPPPTLPSLSQVSLQPPAPMPVPGSVPIAAPTVIGGSLGPPPPTIGSTLGLGLSASASLGMLSHHSQSTLPMMHTQRLHPY